MKNPLDLNKKAKLSALKQSHKEVSDIMSQSLTSRKDPKSLKDSVADMTKDSGIDFKNDSDEIEDPQHMGRVTGRKVSIENEDSQDPDTSVYDPNDINSIEARLEELMKLKQGKK